MLVGWLGTPLFRLTFDLPKLDVFVVQGHLPRPQGYEE